jgi:hypothetical protein
MRRGPQVEPVPARHGPAEPDGEGQQGRRRDQDGDGVDPAEGTEAELADGMAPGTVARADRAFDQERAHKGGQAGDGRAEQQAQWGAAALLRPGVARDTRH